ncbi:hypothetical protein EBS02_12185, partial [bacterium]|nr:hypothetical protein [bacterium]
SNIVEHFLDYFMKRPDISIHFVIFGHDLYGNSNHYRPIVTFCPYKDIQELNTSFQIHKPNLLLETSLWNETYSYSLSLAMITDLPILYLRKTGKTVVEERLSHYIKAIPFTNLKTFYQRLFENKQEYLFTIDPLVYYPSFWENYFLTKSVRNGISRPLSKKCSLFPIYFPQFHTFAENDVLFYRGFTDFVNLQKLPTTISLERQGENPHAILLINGEYNLQDDSLIQRQIDLLEEYQLEGFALYYYWFTINSIQRNNDDRGGGMIMKSAINKFFQENIDMHNKKVFFIWANENWTDNPAFGKCGYKIQNIYDTTSFEKNAENLIHYFKNSRYLKKDGRPVFFLHHPFLMTLDQIELFEKILGEKCLQNG